jgi:anthranilate phosphoribosyltransferase
MKELTEQLRRGIDLTLEQVRAASRELADPAAPELDKADFLIALKEKGESGEELGYFARSFLDLAVQPPLPPDTRPAVDIVGTGGDYLELINVSTASMFLVAAGGALVVKHGNKAITSKCGSADVLEALGIPVACPIEWMMDCIQQTGIGFLFAPMYHPAFRLVGPIRKKLAEQGIATVFNLLGPLLNPARPASQLIGVFSPVILEKYAIALKELGRKRAWVVHGQVSSGSGMDEISLLGETLVYELKDGTLSRFHLFAEELGFRTPALYELRGSDAAGNAQAINDIFAGRDRGARRDLIVINAAGALVVAGIAKRMEQGIQLANELLDSGAALGKLREFQRFFADR